MTVRNHSRRARYVQSACPPFARSLLHIIAAASAAGLAPAYAAPALPTGASVQSGTVTIGAPSNGSLTINQTSDRAIVNWTSFSVGQGGTVNFNNGSGATLNRVTGSAASAIDGHLNATGSVYLINQNGVVVGASGVVNVGKNFVASTLDANDARFNAGGSLTLSGNSQAMVVNYGKIGSLGGDVALVARTASNSGAISAPNGTAGILAGSQITLNDSALDNGKFSVDVGTAGDAATNSGAIRAANAELRANSGNVYALAGNTNGVVAASGTSSAAGHVFLTAGNGNVLITGTVDASSSTGMGGNISVAANAVALAGATLKADGATGGGTIALGGWSTNWLSADTATRVSASATRAGNGGHISAIGLFNQFGADVTAEGGALSGDGGLVETSGDVVGLAGIRVDTLAPHGNTGNWLIDPYTVTISNDPTTTGCTVSGATCTFSFAGTSDTDSNINVTDLVNQLATTNVQVAAHGTGGAVISTGGNPTTGGNPSTSGGGTTGGNPTGGGGPGSNPTGSISNGSGDTGSGAPTTTSDITVLVPISWSAPTVLELGASDAITINAAITTGSGGGLILGDGGDQTLTPQTIVINAPVTAAGAATVTINVGSDKTTVPGKSLLGLSFGSGGSLSFGSTNNGAALSINGTPYTLLYSASDIENLNGGNLSGNYALADSIDATGVSGWVPVGLDASGPAINGGLGFAGVFEGLGNTISNLTVAANPNDNAAVFGQTSGTIRDLKLANVTINATHAGGGLATGTTGMLLNDTVSGTVNGGSYVGGLVGQAKSGSVLVNDVSSATIVATGNRAGGLAGWNASGSTIVGSHASGHISGFDQTGGLVGWNDGSIKNSSASGEVTGADYAAGGLVGYNTSAATLSSVDATGTVDGTAGGEGGLVGYNLGSITNAYATGNVGIATTHTVGGLIGNNAGGTVTNVYAAGHVTGAATKGALFGANGASATLTNGYYDALVTGSLAAIGNNANAAAHPVALNASRSPTDQASYAGFDFSAIWMIAAGQTPTLRGAP